MLGQPMFVTPVVRAAAAVAPKNFLVSLMVAPGSVAEVVTVMDWMTT